MFSIVTFV